MENDVLYTVVLCITAEKHGCHSKLFLVCFTQ